MSEITAETIVDYIRSAGRCKADLDNDTKLFSSGLLDSFFMVEMILHLETEGGFRIPPEAINLDNLDTVGSILSYCNSLQS